MCPPPPLQELSIQSHSSFLIGIREGVLDVVRWNLALFFGAPNLFSAKLSCAFLRNMPVYLCQSGSGYSEPWRHGIQVYAAPFPINATSSSSGAGGGRDTVVLPATSSDVAQWQSHPQAQSSEQQQQQPGRHSQQTRASSTQAQQAQMEAEQRLSGLPIRRVRHAEIVLVDDVCVAFGRYWLRLRWPGQRDGFAGYIAMGLVANDNDPKPKGR